MARPASLPVAVLRALQSVRRRRRGLAAIQALSWLLLGPALLVLVVVLLAPGLASPTPLARSLARLWLVVSLAWPLFYWWLPIWLRTRRLSSLARAVDGRLPQFHGSLATAVDLAKTMDAGGQTWEPQTRNLAQAHLERCAEDALGVSAQELLPLSGLGRGVLVGPLVVLAALLAVQGQVAPAAATVVGLLAPPSPGELAEDGAVEEEPPADLRLRNITVRLQPPAYSGREPLLLSGTSGDFRALAGTSVEFSADLSAPGRSARLQWLGKDDHEASLDGRHLSLGFVVPGAGWYRIVLDRSAGREPLYSRRHRVEALPDHPPELQVVAPPGDIELRPEERLDLELSASDDFALSRLERVVLRKGVEVGRAPWAEVSGRSEWSGKVSWSPTMDISDHGGGVELVVEAWDNDTVGGPKVTRSRPIRVYVPTERDLHRRVLQLKTQLLEQGLDLLAPLLVDGEQSADADRGEVLGQFDAHRVLAMSFFDTAGELATVAAQDRFEKQSAYLGIGQLVENFARRWQRLEEFVESQVRHGKRLLVSPLVSRELVTHQQAVITELEQVLIDLGSYIDLQQGETVREELLQAEPMLADLSSLLRDAQDGKPVNKQLQRAIEALAQQLRELAEKMAERSTGPDDSFQNRLPAELGPDLLRQVQDLIEQGRYAEAAELVRKAMEALGRLDQQLQEESAMAGGQQGEELMAQMRQAIAQAKQLEARQEELIATTEALEQRFGSGEAFNDQQRAQLAADMERLQQQIAELPPDGLPPRTRGGIRQRARLAHGLAEDMQEAYLRSGDLERAVQRGEVAAAYLDGMTDELRNVQPSLQRERERARSQIKATAALARDIVAQLEQGRAREQQTRQQAGAAGAGARQSQDNLRGDVQSLKNRMENRSGLGGSAFNPVVGRDSLQAAGQLMEGASEGLGQGRASQALQSERGALQQLREFRESLEASSQAMQAAGGMGAGSMARRGGATGSGNPWRRAEGVHGEAQGGDVELPDPADFVSPDAFRSLVQEGASGDAPRRYRPMNSSYYEELIR